MRYQRDNLAIDGGQMDKTLLVHPEDKTPNDHTITYDNDINQTYIGEIKRPLRFKEHKLIYR